MPAYFSIIFELNKTKTAIKDFCNGLINAGLVFKSGFNGFENDSFDEIIAYNQNKLDANFALGNTENSSQGFKQMLFTFSDFSEVRLFMVNDKEASTFDFHLIIPEHDFAEVIKNNDEYILHNHIHRMDLLKAVAKKLWDSLEILAIQTAWELSDYPPKAKCFSSETKPQTEPFCIIKESPLAYKLELPFEKVGKNGVLIVNRNNYSPYFCPNLKHFEVSQHIEPSVIPDEENKPIQKFRIAQKEDTSRVLTLYRDAKYNKFSVWDDSYPTITEIEHDLETDNLFVFTFDNIIVGAISIVPENEMDDLNCWTNKNSKEIARVVVAKEYQGQGIAYKMVKNIEVVLQKRGCKAIHLSAAKINIPAYKTYIKAGFTLVGEADMYGSNYYLLEKEI